MPVDASVALLRWYDANRRDLPWRARPGETVDPYRVWLSEIMLQQTTVAAVRPYFEKFGNRWPNVDALAAAEDAEVMSAWAGLGYYARARNMLAAAREIAASGGFPDSEAELRKLPGIGAYTAAAIAAIAFGRRAVAVDSNVERVVARLFAVETPLPGGRREIHALADRIVPDERSGDFAQAMMDLGSSICTARNPACTRCPLASACLAFASGHPHAYPVKASRVTRPKRHGTAWWIEDDGKVLLVRRPDRGLLGGMLGLPTGAWASGAGPELPPANLDWQHAGSVDHIFTHFALTLDLHCARGRMEDAAGVWWPVERIADAGLPTVFAKLARRGVEWSRTQTVADCRSGP